MKILVAGGDGYCGWPTALYLSKIGHEVTIVDNGFRRKMDKELRSNSLTPIASLEDRVAKWKELTGKVIKTYLGDINSYDFLREVLRQTLPDAFVHLAEQRSAAYSMIDREHAIFTQMNNVVGTLNVIYAIREVVPDCHLIKLGLASNGESQSRVNYEDGEETPPSCEETGSMYHLSKSHDRHNLMFASRVWGMRVTELKQGLVYGLHTDETLMDPLLVNRFDYDSVFGTTLNRLLVQAAVRHPLTVYGTGSQFQGFSNILDAVRCLQFAAENPPDAGDFRVLNLCTEMYSDRDLAQMVKDIAEAEGLYVTIDHLVNQRVEKEEQVFKLMPANLGDFNLEWHRLTNDVLNGLLKSTIEYKDRAKFENVLPHEFW